MKKGLSPAQKKSLTSDILKGIKDHLTKTWQRLSKFLTSFSNEKPFHFYLSLIFNQIMLDLDKSLVKGFNLDYK